MSFLCLGYRPPQSKTIPAAKSDAHVNSIFSSLDSEYPGYIGSRLPAIDESEFILFYTQATSLKNPPSSVLWLRKAGERLSQISQLKEDWNDEGALPVSKNVIMLVFDFITEVAQRATGVEELFTPSIFPTIEGGIELYWKTLEQQRSLTFCDGTEAVEEMKQLFDAHAEFRLTPLEEAEKIALEMLQSPR